MGADHWRRSDANRDCRLDYGRQVLSDSSPVSDFARSGGLEHREVLDTSGIARAKEVSVATRVQTDRVWSRAVPDRHQTPRVWLLESAERCQTRRVSCPSVPDRQLPKAFDVSPDRIA